MWHPSWLGGTVEDRDGLIARSPQQHRDRGIDVRVAHEVVAVEPDQTRVRVRDLATGAVTVEPYDQLMVAKGARSVRPDLPGIDADGIHGVQTLSDAEMLHRDLAVYDPSVAVVVGGGYIGLEIAEALVERGLHVTIVETNANPMGSLDPDMARSSPTASARSASRRVPATGSRGSTSTRTVASAA